MGAQVANGAGVALVILYLIVFGFGVVCIVVGFGASLWRALCAFAGEIVLCVRAPQPSTIQPLWQRLRTVIRIAAWFFCVSYAVIVLFWFNRAALPEIVAYAAGCAFAFFVVRRIRSAQAPRSAGALVSLAAIAAMCIGAYSWGLYSGIVRGWSESGYFIAYRACNSSFDRCIESGPYATLADCQRELVSVNGHLDTNYCVELRDVPRAYLPWTR